ncbi:UDP-Glycosyltransferase/glycogen phosphorylase [Ophiobolus disseminans]|uniref:UDP-Glycosyltransferase/glycogen phosphorylase n=1 Tax=Ophiobolus disseminans TaxID=1469910 RepID=A0A6A7AKE3_9PLEO|nr:UDP-Glycosyltransferase/glycogen phosphorylase [Ophiobolus disseminans]
MASNYPPEKGQAISETTVQQSILQQAQAVAEAQTDVEIAARQEALLQEVDLATHEASDYDVPPPPYGDVYGEICNEKEGLGTSAYVTDDGRVNIRINQLNRRLSQLFTPVLNEHVQSVQDSSSSTSPYIPPSLGGKEGIPPPPPLNIVIQIVGSRGDVQPFIALGKVLKDTYGHRVRLATHPTFKSFVEENGLEFFSIGGDPAQLMAFMVKNPSLMPGFRSLASGDVSRRRRDVAEYIQGCWRSCYKAGDGLAEETEEKTSEPAARPFVADCIIANPPSFAHIHCAEKLGIPLHIMFTMPYSPTQAFPHPLANVQSNADPQLTNYISYAMIELLAWQGLGDIINRFRAKCLGLDPVSVLWAPGMLHRLRIPHTYCWSPALIAKPADWSSHISISGFYFLRQPNYSPAPDLKAFLDAGPPPVYIGFGSIVLKDPDAMTELIFEAVKATGQRVLLSKGWGGIGGDDLHVPDNVFMLGNVPHDWLFKHVSCVVHHGGAGTMAAGITAGRPTLVVPFFGDQPFWGAMIARAGAGPDPIPHKQLTADRLADAINFCLKPDSLARAKELASKIATERGSDTGAQSFHQYLEVDRLRCTLAPTRAAVWRVRRTQIRLSAFAACTLANAKLLDFHELKLFRAQEYPTDDGPLDPISGPFGIACRVISSTAMGLFDVPSETWKAAKLPFGPSRQESQISVASVASNGESSSGRMSSTPTSPSQSQTSSCRDQDMMRRTAPHSSKGLGRSVKALIQSPMELSVSITKGFHNVPKLWGDDTVRPQERVTDLKSGVKAVGREFGYGWYDGVTGLATQPWQGARKEGATGFFKGVGKGVGGFVVKPGAAMLGVLGHSMKGVHKEVQKLYGSNVQTYIITSRTAQGYEEWLQSSEAEKEDVITRWGLIQKYLKKKQHGTEDLVRDILETQLAKSVPASTANSSVAPHRQYDSPTPTEGATQSSSSSTSVAPGRTLGATEVDETIRQVVHETSRGDTDEDADVEQAIQESVSQLHRHRQAAADDEAHQKTLRQAMAMSQADAQRQARESSEYEEQLTQVIAQSLRDQRLGEFDDSALEQGATPHTEAAARSGDTSSLSERPPSYDHGHVAGTTQVDFEAQQRSEKSAQEKTEEEIVMEYIKKQSLLEAHHQGKGKARAPPPDDEDDEELQKALSLSMQGHYNNTE